MAPDHDGHDDNSHPAKEALPMTASSSKEQHQRLETSMRFHGDLKRQMSRKPSTPWMSQGGSVTWSRTRIMLCQVIDSQAWETFMSLVILFNVAVIVMETDLEAQCYPEYAGRVEECPTSKAKSQPWIKVVNIFLLVVYTLELLAHVYVEQSRFIRNSWNALDAIIVFSGWASYAVDFISSVAFLRFFRIMRLARALRLFIAFRELYLLLSGFLSTLRAMLWGAIMMLAVLLLWSILLVDFVHPVNARINYEDCERCGRGFSSVMDSTLTLFQQIVAGDSWGLISIPVIEEEPLTALIIVTAMMTVSLGITNLILAVIVERAAEARERDMEEKLKQKEEEQLKQKEELFELCKQMDQDGGGTLCVRELLDSYDNMDTFRNILHLMDIQREELKSVFKVLDQDGSGDVDYKEFCDQLHQIKTRDTRTMLTFMRLEITELKETMEKLIGPKGELHTHAEGTTGVLQQHSRMLASIDDRLQQVCTEGVPSLGVASTPVGNQGARAAAHSSSRPTTPVAPPQPRRPPTTENILADILDLSRSTQELAGLKGVIVRRVEDQVATLTRQAGALASIGVSVKSGTSLPENGVSGLPGPHLNRINEKLTRLQANMQQELAALFKDVDQKLEDGAATLARNTELLASLGNDLGCQPPAQDNKQRGGSSSGGGGAEKKAVATPSFGAKEIPVRDLASLPRKPVGVLDPLFICSSLERKDPGQHSLV